MRSFETLSLAVVLALGPGVRELAGQADPPQAPLNYADSRPMLRVTLRAGEKIYFCHLLIDLSYKLPLLLHSNAARSLRAREVDVEAGAVNLQSLPIVASRDRFLERLTAQNAEALDEVPVAGILGPAAFVDHTLVLDGPKRQLRLLPEQESQTGRPRARGIHAIDLAKDAGQGQAATKLLDATANEVQDSPLAKDWVAAARAR